MLPFLKNRDDSAASGPIESIERKSDEDAEYDMLDAIAEDLMAAMQKKDKGLLKEALQALIDHVQSADEIQDADVEMEP